MRGNGGDERAWNVTVRIYAGVIPMSPDGRIALQERDDRPDVVNPGRVTTFGGLAEGNESPLEAARRELHEELGITATAGQLADVAVLEKTEDDGSPTRCVIYSLRVPDLTVLQVAEGVGALVGLPAELLADPRLTEVCSRAVRALSEPVST